MKLARAAGALCAMLFAASSAAAQPVRYATLYGDAPVCDFVRPVLNRSARLDASMLPRALHPLPAEQVNTYGRAAGQELWPDDIRAWHLDLDGDGARDLVMAFETVQQHVSNPPYLISSLAIARNTNARAEDIARHFVRPRPGQLPALAASEDLADTGDFPQLLGARIRGPQVDNRAPRNAFFLFSGEMWQPAHGEAIALIAFQERVYVMLLQDPTIGSVIVMRYAPDHKFDVDCVFARPR